MKRRPTGKVAEAKLREMLAGLGKRAYLYRIEDAADLFGLNNDRAINTTPKPADNVMVLNGWMGFVECKETLNEKGFPLNNVKTHQWAHARQIESAGGNYCFFLYALVSKWMYLVPARVLALRKGTVPWETLEPWMWRDHPTCLPDFAALTSRQLASIPNIAPSSSSAR